MTAQDLINRGVAESPSVEITDFVEGTIYEVTKEEDHWKTVWLPLRPFDDDVKRFSRADSEIVFRGKSRHACLSRLKTDSESAPTSNWC